MTNLKIYVGILFLFLANCHPSNPKPLGPQFEPFIIGGEAAKDTDEITRSTVSLIINKNGKPASFCTGTIISGDLILTATHCIQNLQPSQVKIFRGVTLPLNFGDNNITAVESWKTHPKYEVVFDKGDLPITAYNDIAVIKLKSELPCSFQPVSILSSKDYLHPDTKVLVAGYGILNEIGSPIFSTKLHFTRIPIFEVKELLLVTNQTMGQGACLGDSGGPAYIELSSGLVVAGITRGSHAQAEDCRHYGEFTNVTAFENFILGAATELNGKTPQFVDLIE